MYASAAYVLSVGYFAQEESTHICQKPWSRGMEIIRRTHSTVVELDCWLEIALGFNIHGPLPAWITGRGGYVIVSIMIEK